MAILWLASYPRSGNTWMRAFVANLEADNPPASQRDYGRFVPHEASPFWYGQFEGIEEAESGPTRANVQRRHIVQEQLSQSSDGRESVVKTHNSLVAIEGLPLIRDDLTASAVYVARDPRDVVVSLAATHGFTHDDAIDFITAKDTWTGPRGKMGKGQMFEFLGNWSDHVRSWAGAGSAILRYEDFFTRSDVYELLAASVHAKKRTQEIKDARTQCSFEKLL